MKHPLIWFVKAWRRFLSPLYGDVCRYYPSCSAYGLRSLEVHGAIKGSWLTISRIVRCNPWAAGGMDYGGYGGGIRNDGGTLNHWGPLAVMWKQSSRRMPKLPGM